ncbi:prepilin peptidase [Candidatus Saccharibacteria bacterium]|nr:prepilin peptidase [Candidatus Saccharibacteria bacterium]
MILDLLLLFLLGLSFGSFVNAWVWRLKTGRSISTGRSMCPSCKHQLAWYDNIPVISFVFLQAKCRYCKKPISWQYPLVELATTLLFVGIYLHFSPISIQTWTVLALWCLASVFLVAAFVYDYKWMLLPDRFMLPVIAIGIVLVTMSGVQNGWQSVVPQLIAATVFTSIYLAMWFFSGGRFLGDGDIRLALAMGLLLAVPQLLVAVFVAYVVGAGVGVYLVAQKGRKRTDQLAFGPFLIIGLYFGLFWGEQIAHWYLRYF